MNLKGGNPLNCHICNKQTESFCHEKTSIIYYRCKLCEYICKSSEYYQNLERQKERYDLHQNIEGNSGYRAYFQRFLDFTLNVISPVNSALDFGCGRTSLLAKMFEENDISCDYYDPIYYPTLLKKHYNLIVSIEVFEHLNNPKKTFETLISMLSKGGYLAIQTEFHPNNEEAFKVWYYHQDPTHIVFFTKKSFEVLAKMYDCEVLASNEKNIVILRKND